MFAKAFKSEAYRISRMKSPYILIAVLMCVLFLINFLYMCVDLYGLMGLSKEDVEQIQEMGTSLEGYEESFMAGFQAGLDTSENINEEQAPIKILGEGPLYGESVAVIYSMDVSSLYEALLLAIFIGLYIGNIYSTGLDRNLNVFAGKRMMLFGTRMLMISIYSLVLHVFSWLTAWMSAALMGASVEFAFDKAFVLYFIVTWLLLTSFGCIVASMTHITRSKAAGITLGIILSAGILSTIMSIASLMLQRKLGLESEFNLGNYTVTQNLATVNLYSDGHFVVRALICAVVYFAAAYILSLMIVRKRDIA